MSHDLDMDSYNSAYCIASTEVKAMSLITALEGFQDTYRALKQREDRRSSFRNTGTKMRELDRTYFLCQLSVWLWDEGYEMIERNDSGVKL